MSLGKSLSLLYWAMQCPGNKEPVQDGNCSTTYYQGSCPTPPWDPGKNQGTLHTLQTAMMHGRMTLYTGGTKVGILELFSNL